MRIKLRRDRLCQYISESGISQNHCAIRLGFSSGHLADLVNGRHEYPSPATREKLLRGLNRDFDDLFEIEYPDHTADAGEVGSRLEMALEGRYAIDARVARGGMGTIYTGRDVKHGRTVAIKTLLPDLVDIVGERQFRQEIRRTASLQHPNIVPILDSGVAAECPYLVTPWVADGSLRGLMDQGRMQPDVVLRLIEPLVSALDYIHERRILHCDIKPENILVSSGQLMLTDLGISRLVHVDGAERDLPHDVSSGTPGYVSPEQASGDHVTARADQFSLACVVFEMLAGQAPFTGVNETATVAQRFLGDPPDLLDVLPEANWHLARCLQTAMNTDPQKRFASCGEFLSALRLAQEQKDGGRIVRRIGALLAAPLTAATSRVAGRMRTGGWLEQGARDVAYAGRTLRRNPGFAMLTILILGIGIGLNSSVFSVANAVLIRPLPYPHPDELVEVYEVRGQGNRGNFSYLNFADVRDEVDAFESVSAYVLGKFSGEITDAVSIGQRLGRVYTVSAEFFQTLGVAPQIGTLDYQTGSVVLSHSLWAADYGSDPDVLGETIRVFGEPFVVAAIMPPGFEFPNGADAWVPRSGQDELNYMATSRSRTTWNLSVVARMADGVDLVVASTELGALAGNLIEEFGSSLSPGFGMRADLLSDDLAADSRSTIVLLLFAVGLVMLIACGNVASVIAARAVRRRRELAVRRSIGATESRLFVQLVLESTVIGVLGSVAGLLLSAAAVGPLNRVVPEGVLHSGPATLDPVVIVATLVLGVAAGIIFGAIPAIAAARSDPMSAIRAASQGETRRRPGLLIVPQYALTLAALVSAGLVIKSLIRLSDVDTGMRESGMLAVQLNLPVGEGATFESGAEVGSFMQNARERLLAIPGVESFTVDHAPPLSESVRYVGGINADGEQGDLPGGWQFTADWRPVGPNYFQTTGTALISGRDFTMSDNGASPPVVVLSRSLARALWDTDDVIGRYVRMGISSEPMEVVGVANDVRARSLDREGRIAVYFSSVQHRQFLSASDIILSVNGRSADYAGAVRDALREVDPRVAIGSISSIEQMMGRSLRLPRFRTLVLTLLGSVAVVLAVVGAFGSMSLAFAARRREMAIRIAIGARSRSILGGLIRETSVLILSGQLLGLGLAFVVSRLVRGVLYEVSAFDPIPYVVASSILIISVLTAVLVPATRASKVDPILALRSD